MTEEKQDTQHTPFPTEEERRTEYVGAKVTPGQKQQIRCLMLWKMLGYSAGFLVLCIVLTVFTYHKLKR